MVKDLLFFEMPLVNLVQSPLRTVALQLRLHTLYNRKNVNLVTCKLNDLFGQSSFTYRLWYAIHKPVTCEDRALLAFNNNEPCGMVLRWNDVNRDYDANIGFFVKPSMRRHGVGKAMYAKVEELAATQDYWKDFQVSRWSCEARSFFNNVQQSQELARTG